MKKLIVLLSIFSFLNAASLSGIVWFDKNLNGIKDNNEKGIKDVVIHLYKDNIDTSITTKTASNGRYIFKNLEPNHKYRIKVDKPKNYFYFTIPNVDNNTKDEIDSDVNPYSALSDNIFLKNNENYTTLSAGLTCWLCKKIDLEKYTNGENADLGTGPVILAGEKVTWKYNIKNIGNVELSNIKLTDDKEGIIHCPDDVLLPGKNMTCIKEGVAKVGQYENKAKVTAKTPNDKNVSDEDISHYLGKKNGACLGNFYWYDENLNGIQDANEPGVIGIKIELYDDNNNLLKTTKTNNKGEYYFCNLEEGIYRVKFSLPKTYVFTREHIGNFTKDSDANSQGLSPYINLKAGENNFNIDAGIYCVCDDTKVNPQKYHKFKFAIGKEAIIVMFFLLILITFRHNERKFK